MSMENWLTLLAVIGPLVGAAVGAIWASFSPRTTQQRLNEALEIDRELPAEYRAEWRRHVDYLVANEAFNDRLIWPGPTFIAIGYVSLALAYFTGGAARVAWAAVGAVVIAVGAYRTLAIYMHLRQERSRLLNDFPLARAPEVGQEKPSKREKDGTSDPA